MTTSRQARVQLVRLRGAHPRGDDDVVLQVLPDGTTLCPTCGRRVGFDRPHSGRCGTWPPAPDRLEPIGDEPVVVVEVPVIEGHPPVVLHVFPDDTTLCGVCTQPERVPWLTALKHCGAWPPLGAILPMRDDDEPAAPRYPPWLSW